MTSLNINMENCFPYFIQQNDKTMFVSTYAHAHHIYIPISGFIKNIYFFKNLLNMIRTTPFKITTTFSSLLSILHHMFI
jgi:hypothetical protein